MSSSQNWKIAVDAPLWTPLTYCSEQPLLPGQRVEVPLGKRRASGVVLGLEPDWTGGDLKSVGSADEEFPPLIASRLAWLEWMSRYYVHPIGQVLDLCFPPLRRTAKTRGSQRRKSETAPGAPRPEAKPPKPLSPAQAEVVQRISARKGFGVHLIHGVTGSGKTEVYLELLDQALAEGGTGLVLVPEIALTPQLLRRFSERFGDQVATLHSHLTDREKTEQWWDCVEGRKRILLGARSALFCPLPNLKLIVIDEEHEPSYKQEEKLKYHARDAAIALSKHLSCPVVLGSATPSIESWQNAQEGKYQLHQLKQRFGSQPLPSVEIVDLRKITKNKSLPHWMSPPLFSALQETLQAGEQSAVFLNRRGFAPTVTCLGCGTSLMCENCDIHLTLHGSSHLVCHYCNYHETLKDTCRDCGGAFRPLGLGTEQVEQDLQELFPSARLARADRDEISNRDELEELIRKMEAREIDILIGTQMIAKGLDFPGLRFVGLALADIGFNWPDFRATERSFQLITQVSGRAGRHGSTVENPGRVLIQTLNPEHPSLQFAPRGDFEAFALEEIEQRKLLGYPPFSRMAVVRVQGTDRQKALQGAEQIAKALQAWLQGKDGCEVLGPAEAPLARIKRQYRYQVLIKCAQVSVINGLAHHLIAHSKELTSGVRISVDVDPLHLL